MAPVVVTAPTSPDRVAVPSALTGALHNFQQAIRDLRDVFATAGGSSSGVVLLRNCQDRVTSLDALCACASVPRALILSDLADTAQALEKAQQAVVKEIPQLVPGLAERILAQFGILLGAIASVVIFLAAPYLAPTATAIAWTEGAAMGLLCASVFGLGWVERRDAARNNLGDLEPALATIRAATVRAEADYTLERIRTQVSVKTRAFYDPLLNPTLGSSENGAPPNQTALPARRLKASVDKSPLCAVLLGLHAGAISVSSEAGLKQLCLALDAEAVEEMAALAQPPSVLAGEAVHTENRPAFDPRDHLTFRPPSSATFGRGRPVIPASH
ncbi:hypothetical protein [Pandoraea sputorum]|uniref:Transmembrane protein n=1 Tax=Pandoraea sputorum TaxID=93222 RepID=A0A5E5BJK3_9BURK|nr:hypothetical protein [Pandoraea sputorum]VVE85884.1 hypothetical protein PSP31121_05517 [Pandoraea sputorum]